MPTVHTAALLRVKQWHHKRPGPLKRRLAALISACHVNADKNVQFSAVSRISFWQGKILASHTVW